MDPGKRSPRAKKGTAKRRAPRALAQAQKTQPQKPQPHPVKLIGSRDAPLVKRVREICLAFPEAAERLSHGEPTWFAGKGKVFAMLDNHHHGSPHLSVWLPQPFGVQEELIDADPQRFFRPPYVGPSGWVGVVLDTKPAWDVVRRLIHDAFVHVATKKLVAQLSAQNDGL